MTEQAANQLHGLLGLAARARQITFGQDFCLEKIRLGQAVVALMDESASDNTKKQMAEKCAYYGVKLLKLPEGLLEEATGKSGRMTAVLQKGGFTDKVLKIAEDQQLVFLYNK